MRLWALIGKAGDCTVLSQTKHGWLERQKRLTEFYIEARCWDGIDHETFTAWLANFPDEEGQYYALRLLHRFIYYSERDVEQLCRHGMFNLLLGADVLRDQWANDFRKSQLQLEKGLQLAMASARIVPLLDKNKPYESGNLITRVLVQRLSFSGSLIINPDQVVREIQGGCQSVVVVDDCVGSGDQVDTFWNKPFRFQGSYLTSYKDVARNFPKVQFHYLTLVAAEKGIIKAAKSTSGLHVLPCETLTDEYRVFSPSSHFFESAEEQKRATEYLTGLLTSRGIALTGHDGLDYAVAFHHNIPDWSLPLFHKRRPKWRPLMTRKDSDA